MRRREHELAAVAARVADLAAVERDCRHPHAVERKPYLAERAHHRERKAHGVDHDRAAGLAKALESEVDRCGDGHAPGPLDDGGAVEVGHDGAPSGEARVAYEGGQRGMNGFGR
jgi:hypothetical protein